MPRSGSSERKGKTSGRREDVEPGSTEPAGSPEGAPGSRRGRMHDAEGTREAILDAGEEVFAEHGFDGARIDAIAKASGYNKSLIFQYFDDKLGLYAAVIRRADEQTRKMQNRALQELMGTTSRIMNLNRLKELLREYVGWYFDYLVEHPRIMRIFNWEMAEGWQTFSKIMSERDFQDVEDFRPIFSQLEANGVMRADPMPLLQFTTALFTTHVYLAMLPLYRVLIPDAELQSPAALGAARQFIIDLIVNGLLVTPPKRKP